MLIYVHTAIDATYDFHAVSPLAIAAMPALAFVHLPLLIFSRHADSC